MQTKGKTPDISAFSLFLIRLGRILDNDYFTKGALATESSLRFAVGTGLCAAFFQRGKPGSGEHEPGIPGGFTGTDRYAQHAAVFFGYSLYAAVRENRGTENLLPHPCHIGHGDFPCVRYCTGIYQFVRTDASLACAFWYGIWHYLPADDAYGYGKF